MKENTETMKTILLLLIMIAILMGVSVVVSASITGDHPPEFGDWIINQPTVVTSETIFIQDGNVYINSNLTLTNSEINIDWYNSPNDYNFKVNSTGFLNASGSTLSGVWGDGIYYNFSGKATFDNCDIELALDGIQITNNNVSFTDCTLGPAYNLGVKTINCSPHFIDTEIYIHWGINIVAHSGNWTLEDPLPCVVPVGLWIVGGTPIFDNLTINCPNGIRGENDVTYTGNVSIANLYIESIITPLYINSNTIMNVSGITIIQHSDEECDGIATAAGPNPIIFNVSVDPVGAGAVIKYNEGMIIDIDVQSNVVDTVTGTATGGSSQNHWSKTTKRTVDMIFIIDGEFVEIGNPEANFTYTEALKIASFTDTSIGYNLTYLWDFGDLQTSMDQDPSHNYIFPGDYDTTLTITEEYGAVDLITQTIYIRSNVTAVFNNNTHAMTVSFTDESTSEGFIVGWSWDFGDGDISTGQNPIHTYAENGNYTVVLTVEDEFGFFNSSSNIITIDTILGGSVNTLIVIVTAAVQVVIVVAVIGGIVIRPIKNIFKKFT